LVVLVLSPALARAFPLCPAAADAPPDDTAPPVAAVVLEVPPVVDVPTTPDAPPVLEVPVAVAPPTPPAFSGFVDDDEQPYASKPNQTEPARIDRNISWAFQTLNRALACGNVSSEAVLSKLYQLPHRDTEILRY